MSIAVRNVTKTFGKYTALSNVSLEIADGELVALLGPSGSGKTTLLRIIAGLDVPDPGSTSAVVLDGAEITGQRAAEQRVGFVFQHYALFRHMTVFENIAFGLRVRPKNLRPSDEEIRHRVNELLKLIQLDFLGNRYPAQLSGGQRQRVALARALAIEPKVLLLDEPFGALDAKVRQELRRWLRRLHDELHVTSILVTHDQDEALEVADRVVVMNQAKIEQVGTPEEVFHHPASEFVMDFLGQVNLFHGRVEAGEARVASVNAVSPAVQPVKIFARPFDLEIHRERVDDSALPAKVRRVLAAGPRVKVELTGPEGEHVLVEMTHERHRALALLAGDDVFVVLRDAKVFLENPT
jgi:sulfate/thiosulfate transport system ATP-binding protein